MLVDAALNIMLLANAYNVLVPTKDTVEQPPVKMKPATDTEPDEEEEEVAKKQSQLTWP